MRVSGQDETLTKLRTEISTLAELLNLERTRTGDLVLANEQLSASLAGAETTIDSLNARIASLEESLGLATAEKTISMPACRQPSAAPKMPKANVAANRLSLFSGRLNCRISPTASLPLRQLRRGARRT